jgi:hypothetical protein
MHKTIATLTALFCLVSMPPAYGQIAQQVVDILTRPGVTQRMLVLSPQKPKAAVVLFAGGHGGLQISASGSSKWGEANFLIRSRQLFADQGLLAAVVEAPSDRGIRPISPAFARAPSTQRTSRPSLPGCGIRRKCPYG